MDFVLNFLDLLYIQRGRQEITKQKQINKLSNKQNRKDIKNDINRNRYYKENSISKYI